MYVCMSVCLYVFMYVSMTYHCVHVPMHPLDINVFNQLAT